MINNSIEMNLVWQKCFFSLPENNTMNGTIPVECFENPYITYFDVGKNPCVLIHAYFCLRKAKVMKYFIWIGNNILNGSISPQVGNMENIQVLFLGKQLMFCKKMLYLPVLYSQHSCWFENRQQPARWQYSNWDWDS